MRFPFRLMACVLSCIGMLSAAEPGPAAIRYTDAERDAFIATAETRHLSDDPYWRTLLHVVHGRSLVDAPEFFLAPDGKHDPHAELRADLMAFFADQPVAAVDAPPEQRSAVERFPARLEWLCGKLGIDRSRLPLGYAPEFEKAMAELGPQRVSLAFPAAYMNTPASMFGHTMLIVGSRYKNQLLSQGINYGALTTNDNGVLQAFKGLLGLYPGYFSLMPYYKLVQEYTDLDQRDIWEYRLVYDEHEIRAMLLHVWELRGIWSGYFFFDENCSYNLLFLVDAARPGLDLHDQANQVWVVPLDTVRLADRAGLIAERTYRPSRATRVRALAAGLASEDQDLAVALAAGTIQPDALDTLPPERRARVLDLTAEYLQSLAGRHKLSAEQFRSRYHTVLAARSRVALPALADKDIPAPPAPERGHDSARVAVGGGRAFDTGFAELALRPAYHDLDDASEGYQAGTQVDFTNVVGRWYDGDKHPVLERFDAIRLRSFAGRDRFYQPIAYAVDTGATRERFGDDWRYQGYLSGGGGLAWNLNGVLIHTLLEGDIRVGGVAERYSVGAGPSLGVALPLPGRLQLHPEARVLRHPLGIIATNWEVGATLRWAIGQNGQLRGEVLRRSRWDLEDTAWALRALWAF
jgi:hypothetical protein